MTLPTPYYDDGNGIVIYCGDCREILPHLPKVDLVLTDPPYGINQDKGSNSGGVDGFGNHLKRIPRAYIGGWDAPNQRPNSFIEIISAATNAIIWGGNYFSGNLPQSNKWLVWDKVQTMPTFSDCELAWTNLPGDSVKKFTYNGSGLMAKEKERFHPTQKPLELMRWCIGFAPDCMTILDPFMGSGTTLRAAKDLGRRAIGIEINEAYCKIAVERLRQGVLGLCV
jgi:DNA modification methylase